MKYKLFWAEEFEEWYEELPLKEQIQIDTRISHIQNEGHFGTCKTLGDDVWELKWVNGRRVYYAHIPPLKLLLLLGGNKNGQDKDIRKAKKILSKYIDRS